MTMKFGREGAAAHATPFAAKSRAMNRFTMDFIGVLRTLRRGLYI
jgi:hypothetical protein